MKEFEQAYREYKFYNIDKAPDIFPIENIFICSYNKTITMKCPCGCNKLIELNNVEGAKPYWNVINGNTLTPSVDRLVGCRSHFSITNGKLKFH